jgi:hypothetical protein
MKARTIADWTCTLLIAFSFLSGGIAHLLRVPQVAEGITRLGRHIVTPPVLTGLAVASWALRPDSKLTCGGSSRTL